MLYDEKFIIHKQERVSDDMGGYNPIDVEVGSFKATTVPMPMDFQLSESSKRVKELRRLITDNKLVINFFESEDAFTLKEEETEYKYSIIDAIKLGKETVLIVRRD